MGLFSTLLSTNPSQAVTSGADDETAEGKAASTTSTSSSSSLSLPTVVQMYTGKAYQLETSTTQIPSYAYLTYQAVQSIGLLSQEDLAEEQQPQAGLRNNKLKVEYIPDLGVWNCRVTPSQIVVSTTPTGEPVSAVSLGDSVLSIPSSQSMSSNTFCWRVDLSHPSAVEPTLTMLQEALVRYLIRSSSAAPSSSTTGSASGETSTTSLYQLRTVQFGLAENDKNSKSKTTTSAAPSETDGEIKVALQICATWPASMQGASSSGGGAGTSTSTAASGGVETAAADDADSYLKQQTLALLYYHLRRYAAALNASLVFVSESSSFTTTPSNQPAADAGEAGGTTSTSTSATAAGTTTDLQPTLSLPQLAAVWRALAQGKAVWKEDVLLSDVLEGTVEASPATTPEAAEGEQPEAAAATTAAATSNTGHALVYGPGTHAPDWIESALLRNAQYPGHWDASQQSVWTILPAATKDNKEVDTITSSGKKKKKPKAAAVDAADQPWLAELRDSVALPATTTATTTATPNKPTTSTDNAKTPDVSDYFANLLNT